MSRVDKSLTAAVQGQLPLQTLWQQAREQSWQAAEVQAGITRLRESGRFSATHLDEIATKLMQVIEESDDDAATRMIPQHASSTGTEHAPVTDNPAAIGTSNASQQAATALAAGSAPASIDAFDPATSPGQTVFNQVDIGTVLKERFVLEEVVAKGGMGVVYKARDRRREEAMDRQSQIAIKILGDEFRRHPSAFMALQREAKKAQQLAHPNIVTVYDFDRDGPVVYMTMELLQGEPLASVIKRVQGSGLALADALPLIRGMAAGLAYAHNKHIVHSDIKPGNVFITDQGTVKLLDFGIARAAAQADTDSNETLFDAGSLGALTPGYASCEMFARLEPDPRDDIYALACMAYELLAGRHPFDRVAAPLARAKKLKPERISGINQRQWRVIAAGLAFEREDRLTDATELVEALENKPRRRTQLGLAALLLATLMVPVAIYFNPANQSMQSAALPDPEPMNAEQAAQVERLLEVAEVHRMVGRLMEPSGSSAYDAYQRILDIHPYDRQALAGLAQIAEHFVAQAKAEREAGNYTRALVLAKLAVKADPRDPALQQLQERLAEQTTQEGSPQTAQ